MNSPLNKQKTKKVLFIAGTGRSGSTLLDLMLGNDENAFSVGELVCLMRPWRTHHLLNGRDCFCNNKDCEFWRKIRSGGERNVYSNIFQRRDEVDFIVDSSKNILWLKNQMKYSKGRNYKILPILIYKTPLEYAYSRHKRGKLEGATNGWLKAHKRIFKLLDDFVSVKYKELAVNPSDKIKQLCDVMEINYFEGKEHFWKNQHAHFLFGSDTVKYSERIVEYKDQYKDSILEEVKSKTSFDNKALNDVMRVLNSYEINNAENYPSVKLTNLKKKLGEYKYPYKVLHRMKATPYYPLNKAVAGMRKFV